MLYLEYYSYNYKGICRCKLISKNEAEANTWSVFFELISTYSIVSTEEYDGKAKIRQKLANVSLLLSLIKKEL